MSSKYMSYGQQPAFKQAVSGLVDDTTSKYVRRIVVDTEGNIVADTGLIFREGRYWNPEEWNRKVRPDLYESKHSNRTHKWGGYKAKQ